MTPSNGSIYRVTGPVCGEFTGDRWIPLTKASDAELWCFFDLLNAWVNNRETGDLRHHRAHYDVIVMQCVLNHNSHNHILCLKIVIVFARGNDNCILKSIWKKENE